MDNVSHRPKHHERVEETLDLSGSGYFSCGLIGGQFKPV